MFSSKPIGILSAFLKLRHRTYTMASIPLPRVTTGNSQLYIQKAAPVVSAAFNGDSLNRYVQLFTHNLPNSTVLSEERRLQFFLASISEKVKAGISIAEAGDWGAVALW